MPAPLIPKLSVPLTAFAAGYATVDQGSAEEVAACVYAIVATPLGSRVEMPEFGIEDPTFDQLPLDLEEQMLGAVAQWEPRASVRTVQEIEELAADITLEVSSS